MHDFKGYTSLVEIGRGGMSTVYRATRPGGGLVALKVLSMARTADPRALRRFEQEMELGGRLQHPNIVRMLDFSYGDLSSGATGTPPFIVMDYVPGDSLDRRLSRGRSISPEQFAAYLADVASALDYAHAQGVVHRDIKPSNILIRPDGRAMIVDFGIAKTKGSSAHTATQNRVGSVPYMSPEQADAAPELTPASDIYSLGVTAFHALTGQTPFNGPSEVAVARMHLESAPPHLEDFNPAISKAVCSAVLMALQKLPSARYKSAGAFALTFRNALRLSDATAAGDHFHPSAPAPMTKLAPKSSAAPARVAFSRGGWQRAWYVPLLLAAVMLAIGGALLWPQLRSVGQPTVVPIARPTVIFTAVPARPLPVIGTREPTPAPLPTNTAVPTVPPPQTAPPPPMATVYRVPVRSPTLIPSPVPTQLPPTARPSATMIPTAKPRSSSTPARTSPSPTAVRRR